MYIALGMAASEMNEELISLLIDQHASLSQLIPMMEDYSTDDDETKELLTKLKELEKEMGQLKEKYQQEENPEYSPDDINSLNDRIMALREYVTTLS